MGRGVYDNWSERSDQGYLAQLVEARMRNMTQLRYAFSFVVLSAIVTPARSEEAAATREPNRPKLRGTLLLDQRSRREDPPASGRIKVERRTVQWQAAETAIIVCDVWNDIWA